MKRFSVLASITATLLRVFDEVVNTAPNLTD